MTGFFGVGGGFVIVPVLTLWLGAPFRRAVATSLVIITLTGLAALASHLLTGARPDLAMTLTLAFATGVGALLGTLVGERLPQLVLRRGFALIVTVVALVAARGRAGARRPAALGLYAFLAPVTPSRNARGRGSAERGRGERADTRCTPQASATRNASAISSTTP